MLLRVVGFFVAVAVALPLGPIQISFSNHSSSHYLAPVASSKIAEVFPRSPKPEPVSTRGRFLIRSLGRLFSPVLSPVETAVAVVNGAVALVQKRGITRRGFGQIAAAGTVMAVAGCVFPDGRDPITTLPAHPPREEKFSQVLTYNLSDWINLMTIYNLDLRRIVVDYYRVTVIDPLREEASRDPKVLASIAAIVGPTGVAPAGGIMISGDNPFIEGTAYGAYQSRDRFDEEGNQTEALDNLTRANQFNDLPGFLPAVNPGAYYSYPLLGGRTVPDPQAAIAESIRMKFRAELARMTHELKQTYWGLVEMRQNQRGLTQLKENYRRMGNTAKVTELVIAIEELQAQIDKTQTDLIFRKVGLPKEQFQNWATARAEPPETLLLTRPTVPEIDPETAFNQVLAYSADYYDISERLPIIEQAIDAAKWNASKPIITAILGYEPPTDFIGGFTIQARPLRFRLAEAEISALRSQFVETSARQAQFRLTTAALIRDFISDRQLFMSRLGRKEQAFTSARAAAIATIPASTLDGLLQLQGDAYNAEVQRLNLNNDQLALLNTLLEVQKDYLRAIRDIDSFESHRWVLQGQLVRDEETERTLRGIRSYFEDYVRQPEIWLHIVRNPEPPSRTIGQTVRSIFPWILAFFGFGAAAFTPNEAVAAERARRNVAPTAIISRWEAPEYAPLGIEPLFSSSL